MLRIRQSVTQKLFKKSEILIVSQKRLFTVEVGTVLVVRRMQGTVGSECKNGSGKKNQI